MEFARVGDTTIELDDEGGGSCAIEEGRVTAVLRWGVCDAIVKQPPSSIDTRSFIRKCARGAAPIQNRSRSYIPKENTHVTARAICVGFHIHNGMREAIIAGDGIVAH